RVADGRELPPNFTITLGREPAWDLVKVEVQSEGRFQIDNLPPETYAFLPHNGNCVWDESMYHKFQRLRAESFGIRLDASLSDFEIVLRPRTDEDDARAREPAVPLKENAKGGQTLSGIVVDGEGRPLAGVRLTVRDSWYSRFSQNAQTSASGSFTFRN